MKEQMTLPDTNLHPIQMADLIESVNAKYDSFGNLVYCVSRWAEDRNITAAGGATSYSQIPKLFEEVGEFRDAETEEDAKLEFGDILIVCIQIARLRGLDMGECLHLAYEKIKDRKGTMIDGRFVKEVG